MKPILFNAEMAQAVRERRKTVTRRVVKPQPPEHTYLQHTHGRFAWSFWQEGDKHWARAPYQPGEILYMPEPWRCMGMFGDTGYVVGFKDGETVRFVFRSKERAERWAKYGNKPFEQWQSPYFMPREAARLFLRVEDVRPERLQSMTPEQCAQDGGFEVEAVKAVGADVLFGDLWDKTMKPADRALYGWAANPWVWVIQFKRIGEGASAE